MKMSGMSEVLAAVAKATGEMKRVSKDSRNAEQRYDFASVDNFLEMAGPVCAANGLTTTIDEDEITDFERQGKYGATHWLRFRFIMQTYHASGESLPAVRRTVEVIRTGAQSSGSAQSYALKQYLRGLHMIPTGDAEDADYGEKGEGAPVQKDQPRRTDPPAFDAMGRAKTIIWAIEKAANLDALKSIWTANGSDLKAIKYDSQGMFDTIADAKAKRAADLTPKDDLGNDAIPYEGK